MTRLPNGLSYTKPGASATTFAASDTTPSVKDGTVFHANVDNGAVTITSFDNIETGQVLYVYSKSASVVTIANNATIIFTSSATNLVMGSNQVVQFLGIADGVACEVVPRN